MVNGDQSRVSAISLDGAGILQLDTVPTQVI